MYRFAYYRMVLCSLLVISFTICANAQQTQKDTLVLSIEQVEKQFIENNLQLLAAHYDVEAQKALIQQAKLWDNPILSTDQLIAAKDKFLPFGKNTDGSYNGQYFIQVEQLIQTAGKRGKLINIATTNAHLSELQLQDLLRNLRLELRANFYNLQQQIANEKLFENQLRQLHLLLSAMQAQLDAGNIAQKEFLRIRALVIALQQDRTDLNKSIQDNQAAIKSLLRLPGNIYILPAESPDQQAVLPPNPEVLLESAKQNNPNFLLQQAQTLLQQQNLVYQKALRVPDITLSPNFDKNSNIAPNAFSMGISLPLPLFNKNQGNIRSAEFNIKQQQTLAKNAENALQNDISKAYNKLLLTIEQNNHTQKDFYSKYESMYQNMIHSYQQKQIGLLEFLDFFNDYTDSRQRLFQQEYNLQLAKEELNYHVGMDVTR